MKKLEEFIVTMKKHMPCFILKKRYIIERMKDISEISTSSLNFIDYRLKYNSNTMVIITDQVNALNPTNPRYLLYTITRPDDKISIRVKYEDCTVNVYFDKLNKSKLECIELLKKGKMNIETDANYKLTRFLYKTIKAIK